MPSTIDKKRRRNIFDRQPLTGSDPLTASLQTQSQPYAYVGSSKPAAAASAFDKRMAEIREFTLTNPEMRHQHESALASRMPTEELRKSTLEDLTRQRLAESANERLQAMKGASDLEVVRERGRGNIRMAELNAMGKEGAAAVKRLDALNYAVYGWQKLINDPETDDLAKKGYAALRDKAMAETEALMGGGSQGGPAVTDMTTDQIAAAVRSGKMSREEGEARLRKMGYE